MTGTSLYNDILELIKDEAELGKFTDLSLCTAQDLYTDFPPTSTEAQQDQTITPLQESSSVAKEAEQQPASPHVAKATAAKIQEAEATPIKPANIDLSAITSQSLSNAKMGSTQMFTGDHFSISGEGNASADLMFIGEAQGRGKDQISGEPSQLLTKMIDAMKLSRETVFIADICHRVPIENPQAIDQELGVCISYLRKQVEVIKPKVIVFLGPLPLRLLLNMRGISKHRGQWLEFMGAKVMPTFHPALLLREPSRKRETWNDLQAVMKELSTTS